MTGATRSSRDGEANVASLVEERGGQTTGERGIIAMWIEGMMERGVDVDSVALKHNRLDIEGMGYKRGGDWVKVSRQGWRVYLDFMR
jgi:hypothetical protein